VSERLKRGLLYVLAALLFIEGIALCGAAIYLVVEIFTAPTDSIASAVALAVCAAAAAVGLIFVARSTLHGKPWIRGAAVAWQVLQVLVAISIIQAKAATSVIFAVILIVPALAIIVLVFTKPVMAATSRFRES
jgi:hypothetical protein